MGYAFLTPEKTIRKTMLKISPFDKLPDGDSIVLYNPPSYDAEVEDLQQVEPVLGDQVQFVITPKDATTVAAVWSQRKGAVILKHLDNQAVQLGYFTILSACSYATSTHPRFGPEGLALSNWRDQVWTAGYEILDEVAAGTRPMPTDSELVALLPAFPGVTY
jgi:hypothetical protein